MAENASNEPRRLKVLLSAFSCGPGRGSEPGVGWNWVQQVSRKHEVWLITMDEFAVELRERLPANVHLQVLPSFAFWHRLQRLPVPGLDWIYYYWWQWKAYRVARRLHAQVGFDLAHHVTFVSWRAPSFLSLLPVPLIWGPVGGGGIPPRELWSELGWAGGWFERLRQWLQHLPRWDPTVRLTMRRAALILVANRETAALIPARFQSKVTMMLGIGMSANETRGFNDAVSSKEGFIVLFAAVLRPIKGGALALRAFKALTRTRPDATLVFVGDGAERARLAALASDLGLADRVQFQGWLPREKVQEWMRSADVLLLPSLRDSGGMVLMEAMMAEKPVVCLDLGGPGEIVTAECGFKVRPGTPAQVVSDLAAALEGLAGDPSLRRAMGEAGRRRVLEHFDWDHRGERMMELYDRCKLASRSAMKNGG